MVKQKLDQDVLATNDFWQDDELIVYINDAYYYYWMMLINARHNECLLEAFLDITQDVAEIALPSDLHSTRLVERVVGNGTIPLWWDERFDEPNYTAGVPSASPFYAPTVRFVRRNLVLEPTPDETVTNGIKLTYYFVPPRLELIVNPDPDIAFNDLYHELLVYRAVVTAKSKEEAIGQGGAPLGAWGTMMAEKDQKFKETVERPTVQRLRVKPYGLGSDTGSYNNFY